MTTALDTELVPLALALLTEYGATASFQKLTGKAFNATSSVVTESGETAVSWKITPPQPFNPRYVDGDIIKVGDLQTFIAASGITFTPTLGWTVTFASVTWRILSAKPVYTGDEIALYDLQLRR